LKIRNLEDLSKFLVEKHNVELKFIPEVVRDIKAINKGNRTAVLALIINRAKQGPLFVPDGVAETLHGNLHGFAKIKSNSLKTRVIYRPVKTEPVKMEMIAIGPRDKERAYKLAAERLERFFRHMDDR